MKKNKIIFLIFILGAMINSAVAQTWNCGVGGGNNLTATLSGGTLTISGSGAMEDYTSAFGTNSTAPWYNYKSQITQLIIGNGVTSIGNWAFYSCGYLNGTLTLPNTVTAIGDCAFRDCSNFTGSLIIPNSVKTIGEGTFANCWSFTSVTIPNSVMTIGDGAFLGCSGLQTVNFNAINCTYMGSTGFSIFSGCTSLTTLNIGNLVQTIPAYAFYGLSSFTNNLIIPNSVKTIGDYAFNGCSGLTGNLIIPNAVTSIANAVFKDCSGLTGNLIIPNSVKSIGANAFENCNGLIGNLTLPDSLKTIGNYVFYNCSGFNGTLTIPNSVASIGNYAFYNCNNFTGNLTIPNSVITIGNYAFQNCSNFTGNLTISNSVTTIGIYAFEGCSGFNGHLNIGNSVNSIVTSVFANCSGLTSLTIPSSIVNITTTAFQNCSALTSITINRITPPALTYNVFSGVSGIIPVYVPCGSLANYQNNTNWNNYFSNYQETGFVTTPGNIKVIEQSADLVISWQNVVGATGYEISCNSIPLDTVSTTNYTDTSNLIIGTNYCYQIKAINGTNCTSQPSTAVCKIFGISNDASLSNLTVSVGTLTPVFNSTTLNYTVNVAHNIDTITITAIQNDINAIVSGDGFKQNLIVGSNSFTITVTAEDNVTIKNYIVTVIRAKNSDATLANLTVSAGTLNPLFSSTIYNYSVNVANNIDTITITAIANDPNATVIGDGFKQNLFAGANPFPIVVIAEDNVTTETYFVTVNRDSSNDATLSNLTVSTGTLTPAFHSDSLSYTVNVAYNIDTITITATPNHPNATVSGDGFKNLVVGPNLFPITVTAEDAKTTLIYNVTVNRASPPPTYTVSGKVTINSNNLANVTLSCTSCLSATATTNTNGEYSFTVTEGANITIKPSLTNHTFAPNDTTINNITQNIINVDFIATDTTPTPPPTYTVSGKVTINSNNLANVTLSCTGCLTATTTTNTNGEYSFIVTEGANITIEPSLVNHKFAPHDTTINNIMQNIGNVNFIATDTTPIPPPTYTVSGKVTINSNTLAGVTLSCTGCLSATTTSDQNGEYSFTVTEGANITIEPSLTNHNFTPEDTTINNITQNITNVDFVANTVGIDDYELTNSGITVYPNPAIEILNFSSENAFEITDIQGRVLLKTDKAVKSVNVSSLQAGVYFVKIGNKVEKFVKQ